MRKTERSGSDGYLGWSGSNASLLPVTVIVCSRNRPALLFETIEGVLNSDCWPSELVIIDQSDTPNHDLATIKTPAGCQIKYVHGVRPGVSAARNLGARLASQDPLVFLDDDLTVDGGWLAAFAQELKAAGPRTVLTGQVREASPEPGRFAPSCIDSKTRAEYSGRCLRDVLSSGNMALYRSSLEAAGGFDERLGPGTRFPAAEDNDLGFRLLESGLRIVYVPEALVWHRAWRTESEVVRVQWRYGIGQGAFQAKHLRTAPKLMAGRIVRDLARPVRSLPERIRGRRLRRMAGDFAFAGGVLAGVVRWLATVR